MNTIKWVVNLGDDVNLPNICDKNCLGCHDDYHSTNLKNRYTDKRNDLFNEKGFNWFPREWKFKDKWKLEIKKHFGTSKASKFFIFSGRGDPLFYLPCIEAYMKVYKELGYKGYTIIYTSGSQLTPLILTKLVSYGIDELRFNLVATDFSQETLYKIEAAKHQMKVSVQIPLLSIYEKKLLKVLPYLNDLRITQLILCHTYVISQTGAEKLQTVLPKTTVITKLTEGKAVIDNQPMLHNIKEHFRKEKYKIPLVMELPFGNELYDKSMNALV
tara:strand:- start:3672 stop:4487 length:816 start_codon:yes stop_codon:yes gene_type:complete